MLGTAYMMQVGKSYEMDKPAEGDKYKSTFENHAAKYPDLTVDVNLIARSYSIAAVYYFRKGQGSKPKV